VFLDDGSLLCELQKRSEVREHTRPSELRVLRPQQDPLLLKSATAESQSLSVLSSEVHIAGMTINETFIFEIQRGHTQKDTPFRGEIVNVKNSFLKFEHTYLNLKLIKSSIPK
jgi:hypothetical protein